MYFFFFLRNNNLIFLSHINLRMKKKTKRRYIELRFAPLGLMVDKFNRNLRVSMFRFDLWKKQYI